MVGAGAAAAANDVQPSCVDKALECGGQAFGRLRVVPVLVRQTGVGKARHRDARPLVDGTQVVGHEIGAGGAVEPHRQLLCVLDGGQKGIRGLAAEHRSRSLDGARYHHRAAHPGIVERLLDRYQSRFGIAGVLTGLDKEKVDPTLEEAADLLAEGPHQLRKSDTAGDRDRLGGRPHRPCNEARFVGGREIPRSLDRQFSGAPVERPRLTLEPVLGEHQRGAAEGVSLDDVGTCLEVRPVDLEDHIGPRPHQDLVATLELDAAKIVRAEVL